MVRRLRRPVAPVMHIKMGGEKNWKAQHMYRSRFRWWLVELDVPSEEELVQFHTLLCHGSWEGALRVSQSLVFTWGYVVDLDVGIFNVHLREMTRHLRQIFPNAGQHHAVFLFVRHTLVQDYSVFSGIPRHVAAFRRAILPNCAAKNYWRLIQVPLGILKKKKCFVVANADNYFRYTFAFFDGLLSSAPHCATRRKVWNTSTKAIGAVT